MADKTIIGNGQISDSDYHDVVSFVGMTKGGDAIKIEVFNAINLENINWDLKDKNEVVQTVTFEGCYLDENLDAGDYTEPWKITYPDGVATGRSAKDIVLGEGKFYIGDTCVGLTRDGGLFTVERTYRGIVADGDKGLVMGRVSKDEGKPKLTMSMLQILSNLLAYPATTIA